MVEVYGMNGGGLRDEWWRFTGCNGGGLRDMVEVYGIRRKIIE
jgi:hypothetical protein